MVIVNQVAGFRVLSAALLLSAIFCVLGVCPLTEAQNFTVLHNFVGLPSDGANPSAPLLIDSNGNLYGASLGGRLGDGAIYKIEPSGKESVLYSFEDDADGNNPLLSFLEGNTIFGTAFGGGVNLFGTVFTLTNGKLTVLYSCCTGIGAFPGGLIRDTNGDLYGTTFAGGDFNACDPSGCGTVFKIGKSGSATFTHAFGQVFGDGEVPNALLVRDPSGEMFGTTEFGGAYGYGTIFELRPSGAETVVYSFQDGTDGGIPSGGVYRDSEGNLYGTTSQGGTDNQGIVFELTSSGQVMVLHSFSGADGSMPTGGVTLDQFGSVYGVTYQGGTCNKGTIFKIDASGDLTTLHEFTGVADGEYPLGLLLANHALYGVTYQGGSSNDGVVFKLVP